MVVAQLEERLLQRSAVRIQASAKFILNIYSQLYWKDENKEKEAVIGPFLNSHILIFLRCFAALGFFRNLSFLQGSFNDCYFNPIQGTGKYENAKTGFTGFLVPIHLK